MKKSVFWVLTAFSLLGVLPVAGFGSIFATSNYVNVLEYTRGSIIVDGVILDLEFSGSTVLSMVVSDRSPGNSLEGYSGTISNPNGGTMYYFNGMVTLNGQQHSIVNLPLLLYAN